MQKQGKFILMDFNEFLTWLKNVKVTREIMLIQEHHTYKPDYKDFKNNHFDLLNDMEASHIERGFGEIAQNITTFPDGMIAICRDINIVPFGIKGANTNAICIENLGNFDKGEDRMTEEQSSAILHVTAALLEKFNLIPDINSIVYHHWYDLNIGVRTNGTGTTKTCPGTTFFGGNTLETAEKYFIPQIKKCLDALNKNN